MRARAVSAQPALRPNVSVRSAELRGFAGQLGHLIRRFNVAVNRVLVVYREPVLDMQLIQEGIAGAVMQLCARSARSVLEIQSRSRAGSMVRRGPTTHRAGIFYA